MEDTTVIRDFTNGFGIAKLAGLLLVLVAVVVGGWLIYIIEKLFTAPTTLPLFQELAKANFDITFTMNDAVFRLEAPELFMYIVLAILLSTVFGLIKAFVSMGSNLLQMRGR